MERPDNVAAFAKRARFTYESARLRSAIVRAWPVPVAACLAVRLGAAQPHVLALAVPLAVAAIVLVWRGGAAGRAVAPGLSAGIAPLILPGLAMDCATACSASCMTWCATSCVAGGFIAGGLVGFSTARFSHGGWRFGITAAAIAATLGVAGMLAGLAVGAVPVFALVPRRP